MTASLEGGKAIIIRTCFRQVRTSLTMFLEKKMRNFVLLESSAADLVSNHLSLSMDPHLIESHS